MIYLLGFCLFLSACGYFLLLWKLWLVDGTLDTPLLILFGGGGLALVAIGIKNASIPLLWVTVVLLGGGSILYNVLEDYFEKTSNRRSRLETIAKLKQRVAFNAADWISWRDLAKLYMQLEMFEEAIAAYKNAIRENPPEVMKLRQSLNEALNEKHVGKMSDLDICPHCQEETPRKSKTCIHCGKSTNFEFWSWISSPEVYGDVVLYIILALAALAITVVLFTHLTLEVKAVIAMAAVAVCGFLIWRSIENAH